MYPLYPSLRLLYPSHHLHNIHNGRHPLEKFFPSTHTGVIVDLLR